MRRRRNSHRTRRLIMKTRRAGIAMVVPAVLLWPSMDSPNPFPIILHISMKHGEGNGVPINRAVILIHRKIETVRRTVDGDVRRLLISVKIHLSNPSIPNPTRKTVRIQIVPILMTFVNGTAVERVDTKSPTV